MKDLKPDLARWASERQVRSSALVGYQIDRHSMQDPDLIARSLCQEALFSGKDLGEITKEEVKKFGILELRGCQVAVVKHEADLRKLELVSAMKHALGEDFFARPVHLDQVVEKLGSQELALRFAAVADYLRLCRVETLTYQGRTTEELRPC